MTERRNRMPERKIQSSRLSRDRGWEEKSGREGDRRRDKYR